MADGELNVELVPDESALENIEEKQVEIAGEGGAVDEAKELNESQDERLAIANRKLGRIGSKLGVLSVIAGAIGLVAKLIGEVFGISFDDVRNAIVEGLNSLKESFNNFIRKLPTQLISSNTGLSQGTVKRGAGALLGAPFGLAPSVLGALAVDDSSQNSRSTSQSNKNVNLFTSRRTLTGDSTQQELETQSINDIIFNEGS